MNLLKVLKNYGLNEKQAKIYLACLELGSATVQKISQKTNLPRSSCYEVLESLKFLGIVSMFCKKKIRYFNAEDPHKMLSVLKEKVDLIEESMPRLRAVYKQSDTNHPSVRFYEGKEGMKMILQEILNEAQEIMAFNSVVDHLALFGDYWTNFVRQRVKKKIPVRTIIIDSPQARARKDFGSQELRLAKIVPTTYQHHGATFIWGNKVALFSFQHSLVALIIESQQISQTQKKTFELIWDAY